MSKIARAFKIVRVACYVRVSTEEQKKHGFSIATQIDTLNRYIENNDGYQLVDFYCDEGVSADKIKKRVQLHRLLEDVKQGKIDMIIFTKLDRWFRSVQKYYTIQAILDEHNVVWKATNEDYETVTANGKFKVNIMLSVAQQERDRTSERIKDVFDYKVKQCEPISGAVPLGFKIATLDGKKKIIHDDNEEMVKDIINYYMINQNKNATLRYIEEKYNFYYEYQSITKLFKNTLLYGCYRGIENYCEPYITKKQFDDLQAILKRNIRENKNDTIFLFSGLIVCPKCSYRLIGNVVTYKSKIGNDNKFNRYRCENRYRRRKGKEKCEFKTSKNESVIESQLLEKLDDYMNSYIIRCEIDEPKQPKIDTNKIKAEMDRLNNMYLKGRIDDDTYDSKYNELNDKLNYKPQKHDLSNVKALIGTNILDIYNTLEMAEKRSFWHSLIKAIYIDDDYNITSIDFF